MATADDVEVGGEGARLERIVELLGTYASAILTGRLLEEATDGALTAAQMDAIVFIRQHGGCSAKALSEGLGISIPSSTRLVDRMVRKGLVDRRESGVDRRLVHLSVTATGEDALRAVRLARVARLREALATLDPTEHEALLGLLERFLRAALRDVFTVEACCRHCGDEHDRACVVNAAHLALLGTPART
jgi:DNA-binding MarR family transcriptional regulator